MGHLPARIIICSLKLKVGGKCTSFTACVCSCADSHSSSASALMYRHPWPAIRTTSFAVHLYDTEVDGTVRELLPGPLLWRNVKGKTGSPFMASEKTDLISFRISSSLISDVSLTFPTRPLDPNSARFSRRGIAYLPCLEGYKNGRHTISLSYDENFAFFGFGCAAALLRVPRNEDGRNLQINGISHRYYNKWGT